jgi:hypothetical protein
MLNTSTSWSINFTSSGLYSQHRVLFSLSGVQNKHDLKVELDGADLGWSPRTDIGTDRWHYDIYRNETLTSGNHDLRFILLNKDAEGVAQLCSLEVLEYGDDAEQVNIFINASQII